MPGDHSSAKLFGRLAAELHELEEVDVTVDGVIRYALQAVWCTYASVVLIVKRRPQILALTDPQLAKLYPGQIDAAAGPRLTVLHDGTALLIADVETETRWPTQWRDSVLEAGIHSAIHLPLVVAGRAQAVFSLYIDQPHGFDDNDVEVAHILAQHASVAISTARHRVSMHQAVDARRAVGQAIGILMERYDLDTDRAFEVLKRYSQDTNHKLRAVADELIATRHLFEGR
ncbi:GAF and ANTAR domain-containing protein [Kribbella qitaiheensis]|uniref:GAF and ANTAR domain-containing protein n=1 Tax=Kribbella qitaiheensis TaxID=1544730 RepID=A0A7G6WW16_9ACTN|nr:GAF and ANTAR domain-containing protein [Kribbella qitaiheensis]QNE18181.1 GAF and ANTAR domain-containing protein [Kribbella qitaiheensis]